MVIIIYLLLFHQTVPGKAPQSVTGIPIGSTAISIAWSPPPQESLNGILQGYRVYYEVTGQDEGKKKKMYL